MRHSLLSPDIVDAIMAGRQAPDMTLANLVDPFPLDWNEQHAQWATERDLGSRLIDFQSQNMTVAARAIAERKTFGHRS